MEVFRGGSMVASNLSGPWICTDPFICIYIYIYLDHIYKNVISHTFDTDTEYVFTI